MKTIPWTASKHLSRGGGFNVADLESTPVLQTAARANVPTPSDDRSSRDNPSCGPTILVPVDFSAVALKALDHALLLAMRLNASILLLHVVDHVYTGAFLNWVTKQKVRREAYRRSVRRIQELAEARSDWGRPIKCVVRDGVAEYEILRFAEAKDVDLIVLGRRRRNPLSRLLVGSVSDDVADLSSCPVLVVNYSASTPRWKAVVAKAGSENVAGSRCIVP